MLDLEFRHRWNETRILLVAAAGVLLFSLVLLPPLFVAALGTIVVIVACSLRYPIVCLCLLAGSIPWLSGVSISLGVVSATPTDGLIGLLGVTWVISTVNDREALFSAPAWRLPVFLFLGVITASASQALDKHASVLEIVKWTELLVVYEAGFRFVRTRRDVQVLIVAIVAGGCAEALLGFWQFALHAGPSAFSHGQFLRAYGTFDQPNPYAGYLNMVLPLALAMSLHSRAATVRLPWLAATAALVGALLASQSRGALLAGFLGVLVLLSCIRRGIARLCGVGVLLLGVAAMLGTFGLVPLSPLERVLTAVGLGGVSFGNVNDLNFSAVERAAHWLAGVRMFAAHPLLGVGIGNYAAAYPSYHPRGWYAPLAHAHNYYINIAAESGIVGLAAYSLLAGSALWYSYAAMKRCQVALYSAASLGVVGALVATDSHNVFDVLYVHGLVALLGLLMALVVRTLKQAQSECEAGTRVAT